MRRGKYQTVPAGRNNRGGAYIGSSVGPYVSRRSRAGSNVNLTSSAIPNPTAGESSTNLIDLTSPTSRSGLGEPDANSASLPARSGRQSLLPRRVAGRGKTTTFDPRECLAPGAQYLDSRHEEAIEEAIDGDATPSGDIDEPAIDQGTRDSDNGDETLVNSDAKDELSVTISPDGSEIRSLPLSNAPRNVETIEELTAALPAVPSCNVDEPRFGSGSSSVFFDAPDSPTLSIDDESGSILGGISNLDGQDEQGPSQRPLDTQPGGPNLGRGPSLNYSTTTTLVNTESAVSTLPSAQEHCDQLVSTANATQQYLPLHPVPTDAAGASDSGNEARSDTSPIDISLAALEAPWSPLDGDTGVGGASVTPANQTPASDATTVVVVGTSRVEQNREEERPEPMIDSHSPTAPPRQPSPVLQRRPPSLPRLPVFDSGVFHPANAATVGPGVEMVSNTSVEVTTVDVVEDVADSTNVSSDPDPVGAGPTGTAKKGFKGWFRSMWSKLSPSAVRRRILAKSKRKPKLSTKKSKVSSHGSIRKGILKRMPGARVKEVSK